MLVFVDIVTIANVDDEDCIGNSLLQIWELRIVHKAKLLFRRWAQGLVKILVEILKLMLGRDSEDEIWSRFVFEFVIWPQEVTLVKWTQSSGPLCLWQCLTKSFFWLSFVFCFNRRSISGLWWHEAAKNWAALSRPSIMLNEMVLPICFSEKILWKGIFKWKEMH